MKKLIGIFTVLLFALIDTTISRANGNGNLGETVRFSQQGLNYATATRRLGQRFEPKGLVQPATFTFSGLPKDIKFIRAYFWISTSGNGAPITLTFKAKNNAAANYPMALIGSGADKCWAFPASLSYRADVTAAFPYSKNVDHNGDYVVSGLPTGAEKTGNDVDGGTLMLIYTDPRANYVGNIIIYDGSVVRAPGTATQTIMDVNTRRDAIVSTGTPMNARAFMGAGDFQLSSNTVAMNGGAAFFTNDWDWWNFYDRPTTITKGQATSSFTVSSSSDCWNWTLMGLYYQTKELELVALEVNQTVQDWENSIVLIEKKETFVRAFVQSNDANEKNMRPRLVGKRNGVELPESPLWPDNPTFKAAKKVTAEADLIALRQDEKKSLNFRLPATWLTGMVELSFGEGMDCKEVAGTPNDCKYTADFKASKILNLKFYNTEWTDENGVKQAIADAVFRRTVAQLSAEILSIYPISKVNVSYGANNAGVYDRGAAPAGREYSDLFTRNNTRLDVLHAANHPPEAANFYLSIMHARGAGEPQGAAGGIPGNVATMHDLAVYTTAPHEIGHLLGRRHVPFCGAFTATPQGFPASNVSGGRPKIGPMRSGVQKMIYGYNSQFRRIEDTSTTELMAYCTPTWISDWTYKALRTAIEAKFTTNARLAGQRVANVMAMDYRIVRGIINLDAKTVAFDPVIKFLTSTTPATPPPGLYTLRFATAADATVKTISFEPKVINEDDPTGPLLGSFAIPALWDPSIKKIEVIFNSSVIGQITASANDPMVKVLFPNGGETLTGVSANFTWEASDADGNTLTYAVEYSKDGGATWTMLDLDLTEKNYTAIISTLGATTNGLIRVLVSDGFNVGMDQSDGPFSTPNSGPVALITSPANDDVFIGDQPINFNGTAQDTDDESFPASALTWRSSIDGPLGEGESIYKLASELSEGEHTIYFTVTDSDGETATDSVRITIQRVDAPGTIYYTKASGDLHNLATWGINPDGSGSSPADFGAGATFQLANRGNVYTMTADWAVQGIISIPAGSELQINGNTLSLTNRIGAGTLSGSTASNLVVLPSTDAVTLNFTPASNDLNNLTIDAGGSAILGSALDVYGTVDVAGTFTTGAAATALLTFKSTAAKTARLAPVTGNIVEGFVRTERYIPARRAWRLMNSPLNGTVSIFDSWQESRTNASPDPNPFPGYGTHITGGPVADGFDQNPGAASSIKRYNNPTNTWDPLPNTISELPNLPTMIFIRGDRGIPLGGRAVPPTPTTLRHTGQLNVGEVNSFVFATGFSAVRNPYQSPVNFATLTLNNVQNNFYLWDPKLDGANGVGAFVLLSYNGSTYDVVPAAASPVSQYIQTGQSFMVRTISQGIPGSVVFKESDKSSTPDMNVFRTAKTGKKATVTPTGIFANPTAGQSLRVSIQRIGSNGKAGLLDEVLLSYNDRYANSLDQNDGVKLANPKENLALLRNGEALMMERRALPKTNDVLQLKLWNLSAGQYALAFSAANLAKAGMKAVLEDSYLKTTRPVRLDKPFTLSFAITNDAASARADRFRLNLSRAAAGTAQPAKRGR